MRKVRAFELKVGDKIALSDGACIVGDTTVTAIEGADDQHRLITLDGKRIVLQRSDDWVTIMDSRMILEKEGTIMTSAKEIAVAEQKAAEAAAFNAARHPYLTYEYQQASTVEEVKTLGAQGFRIVSTFHVREASRKSPRWVMERCSNNVQRRTEDNQEELPF